jgi:toxin YoeB
MRDVKFTPLAHSQLLQWKEENPKIYTRIARLIDSIQENQYAGIGKPEPLKHELGGYWSRRITKEHRLVYKISSDAITVISCKYHY